MRKYPTMIKYLTVKSVENGKVTLLHGLYPEEFILDEEDYQFLCYLDGTHSPESYASDTMTEERREFLLQEFKEWNMVRYKVNQHSYGLFRVLTLYTPKKDVKNTTVFLIWSRILMLSFLPIFLFGWYRILSKMWMIRIGRHVILNSILGIMLGVTGHEILGHAFSAIGYNGRLIEAGVMFEYLIPGGYVLLDYNRIKKRMHRVQVYAAGVEFNMLFAGVCGVLATMDIFKFKAITAFFFWCAFQNTFLSMINLSTASSLDGGKIMEEVTGLSVDSAKQLLFGEKKNLRKRLGRSNEVVTYIMAIAMIVSQIMIPIFVVMEVLFLI